jgi:probable phosphoglycerate mutase
MGKLILVRHGESAGNRDRIFANDPHSLPLTELGHRQAEAVACLIGARFNAELVVSSPYVRARDTAQVIANALELPLQFEPDLYEREVGAHRGMSYDSLASAPNYDARRPWAFKPENGESYLDVESRVTPVLHRLAAEHPTRDVVVVSHGGVMMTLWAHVSKRWEAAYIAPNCGVLLIEHGPDGYREPCIVDTAAADAGG